MRKEKITEPQTDEVTRDESNDYAPVTYVILRNDLEYTKGELVAYGAEIVANIQREALVNNNCLCCYVGSCSGNEVTNNIVFLSASKEDLFNGKWPTEYDDTRFISTKLIKSEKRIGHSNFVLAQPELVGLGFFGIKKYIPKSVKRLSLFEF